MKHNNQIPNGHFGKQWQRRVMTWFDQPGQKKARRTTRALKAARVAPRPTDSLRPVVRCPTVKYNTKLRSGRGFTIAELKAAGIEGRVARTIGITVDTRRRNRSVESLEINKARLESYKARLIILSKKPKQGTNRVASLAGVASVASCAAAFPVSQSVTVEAPRAITAAEQEFSAFKTLRQQDAAVRFGAARAKRAAAKAEEVAKAK